MSYLTLRLPDRAIAKQKVSYTALLQSIGQASFDKIEQVMAEREKVEPEKGLTPEVIKAIKGRIEERGLDH